MRETGVYKKLGDLNYFIPYSLPPQNPELKLTPEIIGLYGEASFALGKLNEMSMRLPDSDRFIKAYLIKEATLSSAIEGIHTTITDVFTQTHIDDIPSKNTQLVVNYTKALNAAIDMLYNDNLPLANRVILRVHEILMSAGEGDKSSPGAFRKQSVKVGELIPPPATEIHALMNNLEKYINEPTDLPSLIVAGLAHVHFETIHPFLDGNGRIGRLLIVLMLLNSKLLNLPILYPSYYFKRHHLEYYQKLNNVRIIGDFEGWIVYYLKAIRDSAHDAHARAKEIEELESNLKGVVQNDPLFSKMRDTALAILDCFFAQPITTTAEISKITNKAYNTVQNILKHLVSLNIISEKITHKRNKLYKFDQYINLLEKDL